MTQKPKHTAPPPNSKAAAYGYEHVESMASHGVALSHTVTKLEHSCSWISDASWELNYHTERSRRIDQRQTGHDIRFKFTGKELDSETGYTYFGARYYDSGLSVWFARPPKLHSLHKKVYLAAKRKCVDPLADKYLSTSLYAYVENNPIMFVDPNGMLKDGYSIDEDGYLTWVDDTGGDDHDIIYSNNKDGSTNMDKDKALCVKKGVIQNMSHGTYEGNDYDILELDNHSEGTLFFEFVVANTDVEWGHTRYSDENSDLSVITTSHDKKAEFGTPGLLIHSNRYYNYLGNDHSHPYGNWLPSGASVPLNSDGTRKYSGDIGFAHYYERSLNNGATFRVYDKQTGTYFEYNGSTHIPITIKGATVKP